MAVKRSGLGRGLDALFPDKSVEKKPVSPSQNKEESLKKEKTESKDIDQDAVKKTEMLIKISKVEPNRSQPRKQFDEDALLELSESIKQYGILQPLLVSDKGSYYEIIAGERRWRAARLIGIKELPCIIRELTDEENMLLAIIENMQREDLNPIEEAEGISQMMETYGLTQEQVSKSLGKSRPYIANSLRLLKIADKVKQYVINGDLSSGHARALAAIADEARQIALADIAVKQGLSVREIEKLAKQNKDAAKPKPRVKSKNADVIRVEEDLKEVLGTKVNLNQKGKKGKIEIEFYSREDLERLIELLKTLS